MGRRPAFFVTVDRGMRRLASCRRQPRHVRAAAVQWSEETTMRHLARAAAGGLLLLLLACAAAGGRADGPAGAKPADAADPWAPLAPMLGSWQGTNRGEPGEGTVRREYRLVLGGRFTSRGS
jgi:hypothetical protein